MNLLSARVRLFTYIKTIRRSGNSLLLLLVRPVGSGGMIHFSLG